MSILKIDLDFKPPKDWMKEWIKTRKFLLKKLGYKPKYIEVFETERGMHIYIKIDEKLDDMEINKLQFLLGDDCTRVKINMWRIERGIPHWNKLFHEVLYRKKRKVIECWYCGNKIPIGD